MTTLPSQTKSDTDLLLADLFEEATRKLEAGEPFDIEAYAAEHPQCADQLRVNGMDIYIASLDPTTKEVTAVEQLASRKVRERGGLSWSPDGEQICYYHGGSRSNDFWRDLKIGKVVLDTREHFGLSDGGNASPDWSPMDLPALP